MSKDSKTHTESSEWWKDSFFWDTFEPLMFDTERMQGAETDVENILNMVQPAPNSHILDAGCGPGRHSVELARKGFRVTGIDLHRPYLEKARNAAEGILPAPSFREANLLTHVSPDTYDGAVSMFQTLGYFDNPEDDLTVCRNICKSLKSGGWLLLESDGKEVVAAGFEHRTWLERDGYTILLEDSAEAAWTQLRHHWRFRSPEGTWHEYEFSYRLFSALEMGMLLEEAGFASVEFFGALDGRPYNQEAERLIALAYKP